MDGLSRAEILEQGWPPISAELMEYLENLLPPRCIKEGESLDEHHRYAGACDLVQEMAQVRASQQAPEEEED